MVKGSSKHVIVVKSPQETLFDQAIFFVKEDAFQKSGVTTESVVQQAKKIAKEYSKKETSLEQSHLLWMALGASSASLLWAVALAVVYFF